MQLEARDDGHSRGNVMGNISAIGKAKVDLTASNEFRFAPAIEEQPCRKRTPGSVWRDLQRHQGQPNDVNAGREGCRGEPDAIRAVLKPEWATEHVKVCMHRDLLWTPQGLPQLAAS